jgi:hypothetical protein
VENIELFYHVHLSRSFSLFIALSRQFSFVHTKLFNICIWTQIGSAPPLLGGSARLFSINAGALCYVELVLI